jgi:hypothetical protein
MAVEVLGRKEKGENAWEKWRVAMLHATTYPQARKRLLEWGRSAKELDALPNPPPGTPTSLGRRYVLESR